MKIRKTAFMLIFAMICNLAMTGCGGSDEEQGRILIAYFSLTGNTREAAQMIADYIDLPEPDVPTMAQNSPSYTLKSTPFSA